MKTKNLLRKIVSAGFLLALIIIVMMACKKKDDTPMPVSSDTIPPPVATPAVFTQQPLHMMTEWELTHNLPFAGGNFHSMGKGLMDGADPEVSLSFTDVGKGLWKIHDYFKHKDELAKISKTGELFAQDVKNASALAQAMITDLFAEQTTNLEDFFTNDAITQAMVPLKLELDSTESSYGYFPFVAYWYSSKDSLDWKTEQQENSSTDRRASCRERVSSPV